MTPDSLDQFDPKDPSFMYDLDVALGVFTPETGDRDAIGTAVKTVLNDPEPGPDTEPLPPDAWLTWPTKRLAMRCGVRQGRAGGARDTLPEAPEDVMRYLALLWQHGPANRCSVEMASTMRRWRRKADAVALDGLTPRWRDYYAARERWRDAGHDPDRVVMPDGKMETVAQYQHRLLTTGPLDASAYKSGHDELSKQMRDIAARELADLKRLQREAATGVKSRRNEALHAARVAKALVASAPHRMTRAQALIAAGWARYHRTWTERMAADQIAGIRAAVERGVEPCVRGRLPMRDHHPIHDRDNSGG